ncbi:MAG: nucleotide sugar dehydrogenase [Planctomycetes bacterium]|jgi:UDP-N-acetyl-D-glucosamine dehydrogenase|nr:nucleotide sugar dehydrogenase [Planctomycetota bacterium]
MLQQKIESRRAVVGVVGLGYVGLPLAAAFVDAGFPVLGFDTDPTKIEQLARGEQYLHHLGEDMTRRMRDSRRFEATGEFGRLGEADAILICVPTPLGEFKEPDLSFIERSGEAIAKTLRRDQLVVLESTTYPGTTRDFLRPILERSGLACGQDFLLAFSPEREDPGRKDFDTRTIPKLVGGTCERSGAAAHALYAAAVQQAIRVSSAEVAESAKLLENIFRSINIALVNELKVILDGMHIDVWEVIEAAATKPFGFMRFTPGPGLGGHCIPIDPFYLTWVARRAGHATKFIELAGEINTRMPHYVVEKSMLALNSVGKAVRGSKLLVLGLAYKPDVDDVRESPAIELIELFEGLGAQVRYSDPHVAVPPRMREHDLGHHVSLELSAENLAGFDAVVVATDHRRFDWDLIARSAKLVVDTRNALASRMAGQPNYFKA